MNFTPRPGLRSSAIALDALVVASPAFATEAPTSCTTPPASTLIVNVKDKGALGDGRTDDTAAIQAAIDAIGGTKGTVLVPKGVYMIDAVDPRLHLKDDMTLELAEDAVLKAIPNDSKKYSLLTISGVANVWVIGGRLEGERDQHKGKSGEWGYGLHINKGAKHITVSNLLAKKMWGDGFYVHDAEDVRFCGVTAGRQPPPGIVDYRGQSSSGVELSIQEHAWHAAGGRHRSRA